MALLWNPENWSQRLAEIEAQSGELKEAPLRRDVRSLGTLLGEVLREQAGEDLFAHVEALRQGTIRRRDAEARGNQEEAARQGATALELVHSLQVDRAILLTRAFAFYFELINLAETNHRKRRRLALIHAVQLLGLGRLLREVDRFGGLRRVDCRRPPSRLSG